MEKHWKVTVWGVRGSQPTPAQEFLEFGGNTACTSVDCGGETVVFDAGTGLAELGKALKARGGVKRAHLFLSHLHLDHVIGLAFSPLLMDPAVELHLYGEAGDGKSLWERLNTLVGGAYWPLNLAEFPAHILIHEVGPDACFPLAGQERITVQTLRGNHPGGSLLYRLEGDGRSLVYGLDCETDETTFSALADFARGCRLVIWDANFTAGDLIAGWGHSTWEQGIALRRAAGAGEILMTHHNYHYIDTFLWEQERLAREQDGACVFAREGMVLDI